MREILFRGKRLHGKGWIEGDLIQSRYNYCYINPISSDTLHRDRELVALKTIGQFTGMHDKNVVKIFEGDLIKVDCSPVKSTFENGVYVVKYMFPMCAFWLQQTDEMHTIPFNECYLYEVIGNIHEKEANNG